MEQLELSYTLLGMKCSACTLKKGLQFLKNLTHSSVLAWRVPTDTGARRLQSMGSQSVGQDWVSRHSTVQQPTGSAQRNESLCSAKDVYTTEDSPKRNKCPSRGGQTAVHPHSRTPPSNQRNDQQPIRTRWVSGRLCREKDRQQRPHHALPFMWNSRKCKQIMTNKPIKAAD